MIGPNADAGGKLTLRYTYYMQWPMEKKTGK